MIILIQNTLFLKEFLACNGCFELFSKMKKGSGASFWCTFSAWFFHKNVPNLILYQWTKFQCHNLFFSLDIKQNVLLSSNLEVDDIINFKIFLGSNSKAMADRKKKEGTTKIQKCKYLRLIELFRWNKKHFS